LIAFDIGLMDNGRRSLAGSQVKPDDPGFAQTSWQSHDVGFAHTSSGQSPDDPSFARTSWLCHDVGFAHTSSGLCPDDHDKSIKIFY
jgi:hypothetical protein